MTDTTSSTLVLIHPIGNDRRSWQFLELDAFLHPPVAIYEMPGHGQKPRQPGMTTAWIADQLVQEFGGTLHLLGIAVGAFVALNALVRHPERIQSVILVNGGPGGVTGAAARQTLFERGQQAIDHGMPSVVDETFGRWFTPFARQTNPPGVQLARQILLEMDPQAWNDIWRANATSDPVADERIAGISRPVSLVATTNDAAGVLSNAARMHAQIRTSRVQYVAGPHMVHMERPRSLSSAIDHHFNWLKVSPGRVEAPLYFAGE
jgi:pimeloyl-ACP methyl ester carboxylesterase